MRHHYGFPFVVVVGINGVEVACSISAIQPYSRFLLMYNSLDRMLNFLKVVSYKDENISFR